MPIIIILYGLGLLGVPFTKKATVMTLKLLNGNQRPTATKECLYLLKKKLKSLAKCT